MKSSAFLLMLKTMPRMRTKCALWVLLCLTACREPVENGGKSGFPRTEVRLTRPVRACIPEEISLSATVVYQRKSRISAPVPAFVKEVLVQPGQRVEAGTPLVRLESKEQHALGYEGLFMEMKSACDGIVLDLDAFEGNYVPEGALLCTLAESGSLVFEIHLPCEQHAYAKSGTPCFLELPDGRRFHAEVRGSLGNLHEESQAERVVAVAEVPLLPEGMEVKAVFMDKDTSGNTWVLPKDAVQSNETLSGYWILTLSADSSVRKLPVKTGRGTVDSIEILSPELSTDDLIVQKGGYGLENGGKVIVVP